MEQPHRETEPTLCHRCGAMLAGGEGSFWIVRIDAVCDPSPPSVDEAEAVESVSADYELLIAQMAELSERELMDQVHRRLTITLCTACFQRWIEKPA
jgi:hypothetical protein